MAVLFDACAAYRERFEGQSFSPSVLPIVVNINQSVKQRHGTPIEKRHLAAVDTCSDKPTSYLNGGAIVVSGELLATSRVGAVL